MRKMRSCHISRCNFGSMTYFLIALVLASMIVPRGLRAEGLNLETAFDDIAHRARSVRDAETTRRKAEPRPAQDARSERLCAEKRNFFDSALSSGQDIDSLLSRLVTNSDDIVILGEEHHTQTMDIEPEIVTLLFRKFRKLNCVFMEFIPGREKSLNLEAWAGTPYHALFKQIEANGQKVVFVDEFKKAFPDNPAMNVSTRNKGMAGEIRRRISADPAAPDGCTGGIMIVGKGHAFSSWESQRIVPMQSHLNDAGLRTKVINLLPFPPKANIEDYVPNDAQFLLAGNCPIVPQALKSPLGYRHPGLPEKIPYYPRAGFLNDFDATIFVPAQ